MSAVTPTIKTTTAVCEMFVGKGQGGLMGKINCLILKIVLGAFVATNAVACIITTDFKVLALLNLLMAAICFFILRFIDANISGLSRDLGISRRAAGKLVGDYFAYYKNVEKISIDEYLKKSPTIAPSKP